jgi:transcriptional regulator NrdR
MHCPFCRNPDSRVIDSRTSDDGLSIRRRRQCPKCNGRFSTVETASLSVVKRSGAVEPFSRDKVIVGARKACQGRPVTDGDLAILAQKVEEALRQTGQSTFEASRSSIRCVTSTKSPTSGSRVSTALSIPSRTSRPPSRIFVPTATRVRTDTRVL